MLLLGPQTDQVDALRQTLPCYLALFGLAEVFELLVSVDALRLRNSLQLIAILESVINGCFCPRLTLTFKYRFHVALIVFSAIQIHQTETALCGTPSLALQVRHARWAVVHVWLTSRFPVLVHFVRAARTARAIARCGIALISEPSLGSRCAQPLNFHHSLLIVVPIILGVALIVMCFCVRALYAEFGFVVVSFPLGWPQLITLSSWAVFHAIGADPRMRSASCGCNGH